MNIDISGTPTKDDLLWYPGRAGDVGPFRQYCVCHCYIIVLQIFVDVDIIIVVIVIKGAIFLHMWNT